MSGANHIKTIDSVHLVVLIADSDSFRLNDDFNESVSCITDPFSML